MKAFKIDWAKTAKDSRHQMQLIEQECSYPYCIKKGNQYISVNREEVHSEEEAILFVSNRDAQAWGMGLAGSWRIESIKKP
jgi:hypothetical protein